MSSTSVVLLTGSRGFTGRYVREALVQTGYQVIGLVQDTPGPGEVHGDISDPASLREAMSRVRPHFVIHLAAIAFVGHGDPWDFYRVNLFGTLNLLEALTQNGLKPEKVILASSSNVYGINPLPFVGEDFPPAPVNHYATSKVAMEHMSRTWLDRLPLVFTRPFNYTGPGQSEAFVIPKIVSHFARKKAEIRLGNLDIEREFNDVRMVAQAYRALLETAPSGATVNICTGVGHRLLDILQLASRISGHKLNVKVDPAWVRPNELPSLVGNPGHFKQLIPDLPSFTIEQTLTHMFESLQAKTLT
jgi:GDP-6-deoxy-D-talose 4-dehydrogenase